MSKFKEGQRVKILDGSNIKNFAGGWVGNMARYVGELHTIREVLENYAGMNRAAYRFEDIPFVWDERVLKAVPKFKVGDRVIAKKDTPYSVTTNGWMGVVTKTRGDIMSVRGEGNKFYNTTFDALDVDYFDLLNEQKIVVTTDGKTTTAKLNDKGATAKCSPDDAFDFETGAKLAIERLFRPPIKVGDTVKVIDRGESYASYVEFFKENNIDVNLAAEWRYGSVAPEDHLYKVMAIGKHANGEDYIAVIKNASGVYLIKVKGLEKC